MAQLAFRDAVESGDFESLAGLLADDVVFRSPAVFKAYEGREATMVVLRAVGQVFDDFRYLRQLDGHDGHALMFEARVGERQVQGLDWIVLDDEGLVKELTVMVRPLSGLNAVVEKMREQLEAAGVL